jgi:hypothetical protein
MQYFQSFPQHSSNRNILSKHQDTYTYTHTCHEQVESRPGSRWSQCAGCSSVHGGAGPSSAQAAGILWSCLCPFLLRAALAPNAAGTCEAYIKRGSRCENKSNVWPCCLACACFACEQHWLQVLQAPLRHTQHKKRSS